MGLSSRKHGDGGGRRDWRPPVVVAMLVGAQIVIGSITIRDIRRRPPELVRGPRLLWAVWAGSNLSGSAVYWLLGRRRRRAARN